MPATRSPFLRSFSAAEAAVSNEQILTLIFFSHKLYSFLSDPFESIFGGGRRKQKPQKGEDIVFQLGVTLADLYNGKTSKIKITHNTVCGACKGRGAVRENSARTCSGCRGQGVSFYYFNLTKCAYVRVHQRVLAYGNACTL